MNPRCRIHIMIPCSLAAAAVALGGCAWNVTLTPSTSPANSTHDAGAMLVADDHDDAVRFGDAERSNAASRQRGAILALYGESLAAEAGSTQPPRSGFGDGSTNLGQLTFSTDGADFDPHIDPTGEWIYYASTQHRRTSDIYRKRLNGSTITQLTSDPADDMMPAVSPDGLMLAFCSNRSGRWDIYIMPAAGGQPRMITSDTAAEIHPSWSPDGRYLAYSRFNDQNSRWEIWIVEVENPSSRHFIDYGFLPSWCPDPARNKILFQRARSRGSRYHSIWTIDVSLASSADGSAGGGHGRNPTEIVSAANAALINPSWSPDGEHIVFVSVVEPEHNSEETPAQSDLWIVRLDGTGRVNLTQGAHANFQPTWSRNGDVIFVSDRSGHENLWMVSATWALKGHTSPGAGGFATVPGAEE